MIFTRQPQCNAEINWANGLVYVWIPANDVLIKVGGAAKTTNRAGVGIASNGSTSYAYSNSAPLFSLDSCSVTALLTPTNIATTGAYAVSCGNSASANPLFMIGQAGGAANRVEFRTRDAANTDRTTVSGDYIPAWTSGVPCVVTGTRSLASAVQNVYAGGVLAGTVAVGAASATTFDRFAIGGLLRSTFALGWAGITHLVLIHDRPLSATEIASLAANPWQVFSLTSRGSYAFEGGAAGISGTLATTLENAILVASGAVTNQGAFSTTLADAVLAAAGNVGSDPSGDFSTTLAGMTMAAVGTVDNRGAFASTLANATLAASGTVAEHVDGEFASTMQDATLAASGFVGEEPVISGTITRRRLRPRRFQVQ